MLQKREEVMKQNTLGTVLAYYREKYGFSLEMLSDGICSSTTLFRVESGLREIDSLMAEALLGRVGKEVTQFELLLNDEDYMMWQKRDNIHVALKEKRYSDVMKKVCEYESRLSGEQKLHWQRCLAWRVQVEAACGDDGEKVIHMAAEALSLSIQSINAELEGQLYNPLEIRLILVLARYNYFLDMESAENRLLRLVKYVETYYSGRMREILGIEILFTLIELMEKNREDEKVINYVEKSITLLGRGHGIRCVAELHYMKAQAMERYYGVRI